MALSRIGRLRAEDERVVVVEDGLQQRLEQLRCRPRSVRRDQSRSSQAARRRRARSRRRWPGCRPPHRGPAREQDELGGEHAAGQHGSAPGAAPAGARVRRVPAGRITRIGRLRASARLVGCRSPSSPPSIRPAAGSRLEPSTRSSSAWTPIRPMGDDSAAGPEGGAARRAGRMHRDGRRQPPAQEAAGGRKLRDRGERRVGDAHPRVFTAISVEHRVGGAVEVEALRRSIELSATRYCPVSAMLSAVATIEHRYRLTDATGRPRRGRGGGHRTVRHRASSSTAGRPVTTRCGAPGRSRAPARRRPGRPRGRTAWPRPGRSAPARRAARGWRPTR